MIDKYIFFSIFLYGYLRTFDKDYAVLRNNSSLPKFDLSPVKNNFVASIFDRSIGHYKLLFPGRPRYFYNKEYRHTFRFHINCVNGC